MFFIQYCVKDDNEFDKVRNELINSVLGKLRTLYKENKPGNSV